MYHTQQVAVVIPCFRVKRHILRVIARLPHWIDSIIVVDDACPESSGQYLLSHCDDYRLSVLFHTLNQGVGGAMITGYQHALDHGIHLIVKLDGDDQMNPEYLAPLLSPLALGIADYSKGNRFHSSDSLISMPTSRLIGNAILSMFSKLSTGYWHTMDPNNGFTAITAAMLQTIPFRKLHTRYFFESDMLFRLALSNARVVDVRMRAVYQDEISNLRISSVLFPFLYGHARNYIKRTLYQHFVYDMSIASLELLAAFSLAAVGVPFAIYHWVSNALHGTTTPTGTVVLSAFLLLIALQLFLSYLNYDMQRTPRPTTVSLSLPLRPEPETSPDAPPHI